MSVDNQVDNLETSVRVAVRIRPQVSRELIDQCQVCTSVTPGEPQVWLGKDHAFTYDYVFDIDSKQDQIYDNCVRNLVEGCFSGYNATVLAYGQTGSGKTYTMGTGFEPTPLQENEFDHDLAQGIVPRAVQHLFGGIERRKCEARQKNQLAPEFKVTAQFLELYNEELIDLLDETHNNNNNQKQIRILEDNGSIQMIGVTSRSINSVSEAFDCLRVGALSRTTGATNMNTQSSRSHAIFTLSVNQTRIACDAHDVETLSAKFHFVDLAGSERLKRTGATGERAKEGISINSGLLCLGNVISALGDQSKKATHIPYRDSKLTRLLQDSLGGNSQTLMIACISPSDRDTAETLSTLRYANRAKNIRNKVVVNHDTSSHTIASLRRQIERLEAENFELRQGKRTIDEEGTENINDTYLENIMFKTEIQNLKSKNKALKDSNDRLLIQNSEAIANNTSSDVKDLVQAYLSQIEDLKVQLVEMEYRNSRKQLRTRNATFIYSDGAEISSDKVIEDCKREVDQMKSYAQKMSNGTALINSKTDDINSTQHSSRDYTNMTDADFREDNDDDVEPDGMSGDDVDVDDEEEEDEDERLAELNHAISSKELLINELEKAHQKMQSIKLHYESKLLQLQEQITEIVKERDLVLMKLTQSGTKTDEGTKKVREDYDKKIKLLQQDLRKMQDAKKEHAIAMKNQAKYELQVRKLRNEVSDMKKQKVHIMNKARDDANKHRVSEKESSKKIAQLTKQERLKDVRIKNLEMENERMRQALKRKDAEVRVLKNKNNSALLMRQQHAQNQNPTRNKWVRIEHRMNQINNRTRILNTCETMLMGPPRVPPAPGGGPATSLQVTPVQLSSSTVEQQQQQLQRTHGIQRARRPVVELPGDELFTGPNSGEKARRLTRTPQELLFEKTPSFEQF